MVVVVVVLVVVEVLVVVVVLVLVVVELLVVELLVVDVLVGAPLVGAGVAGAAVSGAAVAVASGGRELDPPAVLAVGSADTSSEISSDPVPHDAPRTQTSTNRRRMEANGIGSVAP